MGLRRVAAITGVMLALTSTPRAHAGEVAMATEVPFDCAENSQDIPLASALVTPHIGKREESLVWDARYIVEVNAASDFRGGRITFAVPLPPGEVIHPTAHIAPIMEAGRVVAVCVRPEALEERTIAASFVQTRSSLETQGVLGAPVAAGNVVQIIDTSALPDTRLDVNAGDILEKHVGYVAPRGVSHDAREEARRLTGIKSHLSSSPVYVRGDDVRAASGLTGRVVSTRARSKSTAVAIGVLFAGLIGALVLLAQRLRHHASVERADALLASEIEKELG